MPNTHDYREAADRFRRLAVDLERAADARPVEPADLATGPVRVAFDDALHAVRRRLARAGAELRHLAAVCDRRAEVCAAYARAVRRHSQLGLLDSWTTPPPARPAPWVDL